MQFVISGRIITLENLDPAIDKAFLDLYNAFFLGHTYNWAAFEKAAIEFFDRTSGAPSPIADKFFNRVAIVWRWMLDNGRSDDAEALWKTALQPALKWESLHPGTFIHKGTPFYFWGMTAVNRGDLDKGFALMHQALSEDVRTTGSDFVKLPAYAFATLDYEKVDQAFREWVLSEANFLNKLLATYCSSYTSKLELAEFRRRFLLKPPSMDAVFLFVYALARLLNLDRVRPYALESDFAGQLEINMLFDVTLVTMARTTFPRRQRSGNDSQISDRVCSMYYFFA